MKYKDAGVDIDRAEIFKRKVKQLVRRTYNKSVLTDIGLFGGMYSFPKRYTQPVLVSSIDGVGTKTIIARLMREHEVIGYDVVSHGANDILAQAARPLYFLDYIGTAQLDNRIAIQLINGMVKACRDVGCCLIGGETAQMQDVYKKGEYDLVGCIIGIVERKKIIAGRKIKPGDKIIGLPSTGLHTNGYTLARKVLLKRYKVTSYLPELKTTVGKALLQPHRSYVRHVFGLARKHEIKGIAHITGGGLIDNIPRILPPNVNVVLERKAWSMPPVFKLIQQLGRVPVADMYRTFNMGIGMVLVIDKNANVPGQIIGEVVKGKRKVIMDSTGVRL